MRWTNPTFALGLCLAALALPAPAEAADPAEEARVRAAENALEVLARFEAAAGKRGLGMALPKLVEMHNALRTDAVRRRIQSALGDLLGNDDLGGVRLEVADALGRLNDPKGAYGVLRRHLPGVKVEAAGPLPLRVVQAVGALAPDAAAAPLLRLMEKAKDPNVSRYAIQALGKFGWSKKRVSILKSVAGFLLRLKPGAGGKGPGRGGGQAARRRYDFLRGTATAALNELTGRELSGAEEWLALYKANKKSLQKLFTVER